LTEISLFENRIINNFNLKNFYTFALMWNVADQLHPVDFVPLIILFFRLNTAVATYTTN